jgi:hypothetical protein
MYSNHPCRRPSPGQREEEAVAEMEVVVVVE